MSVFVNGSAFNIPIHFWSPLIEQEIWDIIAQTAEDEIIHAMIASNLEAFNEKADRSRYWEKFIWCECEFSENGIFKASYAVLRGVGQVDESSTLRFSISGPSETSNNSSGKNNSCQGHRSRSRGGVVALSLLGLLLLF
ncbi:hypothetical protein Glove_157g3 [Diversispora epigaea]|uniref:Uncharacterized protein n=1 Tax=Diversispora epigaea TaxID=1348612 RepID=A0A397IRT9_9GLOM|nr:hypothetical protein Glove_157g3 [Diversispora epigaea]